MEYQYKVKTFTAEVTTADVEAGTWGDKTIAQLELLLEEHARQGWELQGQFKFPIEIEAVGCINAIKGLFKQDTGARSLIWNALVFRKPM